jgi:hypothetical protein
MGTAGASDRTEAGRIIVPGGRREAESRAPRAGQGGGDADAAGATFPGSFREGSVCAVTRCQSPA